jgi:hypothetical protein
MKQKTPIYLSWVDDANEARSLYFDLAFSDGAKHTSEITKYPVEQGANVADHVRVQPLTLAASVFISNTPIDDLPDHSRAKTVVKAPLTGSPLLKVQGATVAQFTDTVWYDGDFIAGTYAQLRDLHDQHTLLTVTTPIKSYQNMIITSVSLQRDKDNSGDGAKFDLEFEQITIVRSELVTSATVPQATPTVPKGQTDTQPPDDGDKQSVLRSLLTGGGLPSNLSGIVSSITG